MHSEDVDCDMQQDHNTRRQQQALQRRYSFIQQCCNHKKQVVIAVFLSGCILSAYRVLEYRIIISPKGQEQTTCDYSLEFGQTTSDSNTNEVQWLNQNGKSYYIETNKHTWDYADTFCKEQSSNLAVITKTEELNFILNYTAGHTWVGLNKVNGKWNWIDGTAFHSNILKEDIQQMKSGFNCASVMKGGLFFAAPCKTHNHWVCEKLTEQK
ncbi:asialoglycoprotein receptor 2-like [Polypterus senegalus]|uniref:asialoglycoprotein receptor 2-like n=1 Tax=Polypterus senegalus TaxID=55291 RepID=UPI001962317E|nr:asialoglycoprotein receptor 2-like [Polypterus senegalus]